MNFDIDIQNVVLSSSLGHKINLDDVLKNFRNVNYRPKKFPGLVFRLKRPKTTTLIFTSGKMICTGAKSEKSAKSALRKVIRDLKDNGIHILNKPRTSVQNMVASADLKHRIDLETAADLFDMVMYEPEQFPGLIYRMVDPKTVLLLFASGKVVCTGGKSEDMVHESVTNVYNRLEEYDLLYKE